MDIIHVYPKHWSYNVYLSIRFGATPYIFQTKPWYLLEILWCTSCRLKKMVRRIAACQWRDTLWQWLTYASVKNDSHGTPIPNRDLPLYFPWASHGLLEAILHPMIHNPIYWKSSQTSWRSVVLVDRDSQVASCRPESSWVNWPHPNRVANPARSHTMYKPFMNHLPTIHQPF